MAVEILLARSVWRGVSVVFVRARSMGREEGRSKNVLE
jgi:hypothetical protein